MVEILGPSVVEQRFERRLELAVQVWRVRGDEPLVALGVKEDETVGGVDVVGERLMGPLVQLGRLVLGDLLIRDTEELPQSGQISRVAGEDGQPAPNSCE